jgi:hypothetical protein
MQPRPEFVMRPIVRAIALVLPCAAAARASAQMQAGGADKATPAAATGRLITPADLKSWNAIRQSALSNDGKWFVYEVGPAEGNATIVVRKTADSSHDDLRRVTGPGGGSIAISGDSHWLGYVVTAPRAAALASGRKGPGRAGAVPGAGSASADTSTGPAKLVLTNLTTGTTKEFDRIRRFAFNTEDASWVVMQDAAGGAASSGRGGDVGRVRWRTPRARPAGAAICCSIISPQANSSTWGQSESTPSIAMVTGWPTRCRRPIGSATAYNCGI